MFNIYSLHWTSQFSLAFLKHAQNSTRIVRENHLTQSLFCVCCLSSFACVRYAWVYMFTYCGYKDLSVGGAEVDAGCLSGRPLSILFIEAKSLSPEHRDHSYYCWPACSRDLNPRPHNCQASDLSTESSLQPHKANFTINNWAYRALYQTGHKSKT